MAEINIILDLVSEIDVAGIEVDIQLFKYQGFDPESVIKHFIEMRAKKGIPNENFKLDLRSLIAAGIVMGNVTEKNIEKVSKEGKSKLNELYSRYNLKKGGVGRQRDAVTMPRIMSTFPILASRCLEFTSPRNYGDELNCSYLPDCMKLSVFPALIPSTLNSVIKKTLLMLSAAYTTEQSIAISGNDLDNSSKVDIASTFMKQYDFATIGHRSKYPSTEDRVEHFGKLLFHYDNMKFVYDNLIIKVNHLLKTKVDFPSTKMFDSANVNYEGNLE